MSKRDREKGRILEENVGKFVFSSRGSRWTSSFFQKKKRQIYISEKRQKRHVKCHTHSSFLMWQRQAVSQQSTPSHVLVLISAQTRSLGSEVALCILSLLFHLIRTENCLIFKIFVYNFGAGGLAFALKMLVIFRCCFFLLNKILPFAQLTNSLPFKGRKKICATIISYILSFALNVNKQEKIRYEIYSKLEYVRNFVPCVKCVPFTSFFGFLVVNVVSFPLLPFGAWRIERKSISRIEYHMYNHRTVVASIVVTWK